MEQWYSDINEVMSNPYTSVFDRENVKNSISLAKKHKFWNTQPVRKFFADPDIEDGPILKEHDISKVSDEPIELPEGFEWTNVSIKDKKQLKMLSEFLTEHYEMFPSESFKFQYSPELILWALDTPVKFSEWHFGVRAKETGKLMAFISGTPR